MSVPRRQFLGFAAGMVGLPMVPRIAMAQDYPSRPVRVLVPYAAGGGADVFTRLVVPKLSEHFDKQFFIENVGGAGGNIGMGRGARAAPDGLTIIVVASPFVINPTLYDKVPYDPIVDFDPVTLAATTTCVLTVNALVPVTTVGNLISFIKSNPGRLSFASPGTGTTPHLVGELFRLSLGLDLVHVPFNSGGLAIGSTIAGHTPISFGVPASAVTHIADGRLRALAVTSNRRSLALPGVPTMAEVGFPDIEGEQWYAVVVPAGTPKDIVDRLNRAFTEIVGRADIRERLATLGFEPVASLPDEFATQIRSELVKWEKVIRTSGIKAE